MKNKLILFIKGLLLYVTALFISLFIMGIDSIYDQGYLVKGIIIGAILYIACLKSISYDELKILTFQKYFD